MKKSALILAVWASLGISPGAFAWDILPAFSSPKPAKEVIEASEKKLQLKAENDEAAKQRAHYKADISEARSSNGPRYGKGAEILVTFIQVPPGKSIIHPQAKKQVVKK